jgi:hypothetical protein
MTYDTALVVLSYGLVAASLYQARSSEASTVGDTRDDPRSVKPGRRRPSASLHGDKLINHAEDFITFSRVSIDQST